MHITFPKDFLWGAATSGYQIEGAPATDGKGASIWDHFTHLPGKILHGDTGDRACDTYDPARLTADLDLMTELGLKSYIFSVQWPRIQPDGRGPANAKGLDYYRRLVDGLGQRGIVPALTLYHWELPQALQERGGWLERDTVERFVDYAAILHDALGAQVPYWITQNEPHTSSWLGHGSGRHAPGITGDENALKAAHHLLLSHGRVIQALRPGGGGGSGETRFGAVIAVTPVRPANPSNPADVAAAIRVDGEQNRLFLDPIFLGEYPRDIRARYREATRDFDFVQPDDLAVIHTPPDFLGVNYYTPTVIAAGPDDRLELRAPMGPATAMGWAIDPAGMHEVLTRVQREYSGNLPLIVSENGASFRDYLDPEGRCHDPERVEFLQAHLREARRAVADGVPLTGYFVWSLLDNFEWDSGYRERFGLTYVDYATQRRVPKTSFHWYHDTIMANGFDVNP